MQDGKADKAKVQVAWPVDLSHMRPEDAAEWVVARYGSGGMPIRPERIAKRMGIRVLALTAEDESSAYVGQDGRLRIVVDLSSTPIDSVSPSHMHLATSSFATSIHPWKFGTRLRTMHRIQGIEPQTSSLPACWFQPRSCAGA